MLLMLCVGCANSDRSNRVESATLKQEMFDLYVESMVGTTAPSDGAVADAKRTVNQSIIELRRAWPDFLLVTRSKEEALKAGRPVSNADQRILAGRTFLEEYQIAFPGLLPPLLEKHDAGEVDAVRAE